MWFSLHTFFSSLISLFAPFHLLRHRHFYHCVGSNWSSHVRPCETNNSRNRNRNIHVHFILIRIIRRWQLSNGYDERRRERERMPSCAEAHGNCNFLHRCRSLEPSTSSSCRSICTKMIKRCSLCAMHVQHNRALRGTSQNGWLTSQKKLANGRKMENGIERNRTAIKWIKNFYKNDKIMFARGSVSHSHHTSQALAGVCVCEVQTMHSLKWNIGEFRCLFLFSNRNRCHLPVTGDEWWVRTTQTVWQQFLTNNKYTYQNTILASASAPAKQKKEEKPINTHNRVSEPAIFK